MAGIYSANLANDLFKKIGMGGVRYEWLDLFVLIALISIAGILGNTIGYWTGKKDWSNHVPLARPFPVQEKNIYTMRMIFMKNMVAAPLYLPVSCLS